VAYLEVQDLWKSFGGTGAVLQGLGFAQERGEILCLLGASGCGKTTVLQILAGLMQADSGRVQLGGRDQEGVPVHDRRIGYVFQDHVLFPHLSVGRNVEYGLRMLKWPARQRAGRVREMLALVDLAGYEERSIRGLSGGESQRVALARSLAPAPDLLLLDEPLSSVDQRLRGGLVAELRSVLEAQSITAVYVTHDLEEAYFMGDRVAFLHGGRVNRMDAPAALVANPVTVACARYLGMGNIFALDTSAGRRLKEWALSSAASGPDQFGTGTTHLLIRPQTELRTGHCDGGQGLRCRGKVAALQPKVNEVQVELALRQPDLEGATIRLNLARTGISRELQTDLEASAAGSAAGPWTLDANCVVWLTE
jgi:ABC-type Fe3+/spermidine/putrescine transport system ATPase subunit